MKYRKPFTTRERLRYGYYQFMDHFFGRERVFRWHNTSRRKHYARLHERLSKGEKGQLFEVERRSNLSIEELQKEYIKKGIPVVLEGAAKDWACVKEWDLDYFKQRYGDEEILLVNHDSFDDVPEKKLLADVLNEIRSDASKYLRFYPLLQKHPEHLLDFDLKWLRSARHKIKWDENFQVFMGGESSETQLHNALSCNLFTQIHGEKEWVLYPPYYSMIFDPEPAQNVYRMTSSAQGSLFKPFHPDYKAHPLFEYMDGVKVTLKPGDVLYNPPYWWHAVKNTTDSIGVGYRWLPPLHSLRQAPLYFLLDLCATNPSLYKTLKLVKTDVNLIWLAQTGQLEAFLKAEKVKKGSYYENVS